MQAIAMHRVTCGCVVSIGADGAGFLTEHCKTLRGLWQGEPTQAWSSHLQNAVNSGILNMYTQRRRSRR